MKGVELGTTKRMSEVIAEVTGAGPERIAVVSGPNLAKRSPSGSRRPASSRARTRRWPSGCSRPASRPYFRPYTNTDVVGVELGGAVKNVIALAVGMAEGMGMGDNSQASIITRGLAETPGSGWPWAADAATFAGLAGVGDLVATCMSPLSRNRTFGENLGRGMTLEEVVAVTRQTAEGVKSCESILRAGRAHDVDMPIIEHVVAAVHDGLPPAEIVAAHHEPQRQGRERLSDPDSARVPRASTRSAQRSSTSSMPTESRSSVSGTRGSRRASAGAARGSTRRRRGSSRAPTAAWRRARASAAAASPRSSTLTIAPSPG